jgi:hypothetical protein
MSDVVFVPPTDLQRSGLVCTPHEYDGKTYKDFPSLANDIITLWWNTLHQFQNQQWADIANVEDVLKFNWGYCDYAIVPTASLLDALKFAEHMKMRRNNQYGSKEIYPPADSVLVNESWPPKKITQSELEEKIKKSQSMSSIEVMAQKLKEFGKKKKK